MYKMLALTNSLFFMLNTHLITHALAPLFTIHRALKSKGSLQWGVLSKIKHKCMLANLSMYLAAFYYLTRYNRDFITAKEPPKCKTPC